MIVDPRKRLSAGYRGFHGGTQKYLSSFRPTALGFPVNGMGAKNALKFHRAEALLSEPQFQQRELDGV